jgi:hypothetical protein
MSASAQIGKPPLTIISLLSAAWKATTGMALAPTSSRFDGSGPMLIRLLREHDHSFGPDEITGLVAAYEDALAQLGLVNRDDPATMLLAKTIIEAAKAGERDPQRLRAAAIRALAG